MTTAERRTSRKQATRAEWHEIVTAKRGPCRICKRGYVRVNYHHLVPRSLGGDDVADNIVPLCGSGLSGCHGGVEARRTMALRLLRAAITPAEHDYIIGKLGPEGIGRLFG